MIFQSSKFGHDISTWQDDPNVAGSVNFQKMRDNGASFVIMRASVGNQYDVDFPTYKINSRGILPRGVYHYYWNNIDPKVQAQTCIAAIGGEAIEGRVWLDLETREAGVYRGSAHWRTFIETIQAAGYRVGIYTGYYWWKDEAVNKGADLNYFAQFPLWQAWYTSDPAIVQIAQGWGKMMLWQDTSSYPGSVAGVESPTIDHNFWNDAYNFNTEWGTTTIQDGYQELTRYGSAMYLWRGTPKKVHVTDNKGALIRPSTYAGTMANVITNGDGWWGAVTSGEGWDKLGEYKPLSLARSDGTWTQDIQFDFRPFINFKTTGQAVISSNDITDAYNLVSGTRTLIKAGYITPALSGTEAQFTARHPRTAIGITQDNKLVSLVVDGRSAISQGVTLLELANVMQEAGAWYALELDGGDSSVMIRNGFKVSKNGDLINGVRVERATVNSILIYETEQTTMRYTATATVDNTRLRSTSNVNLPYVGSYPKGTKFNGDVLFVAAPPLASNQLAGDKWLEVKEIILPDGTTLIKAGWVAIIHMGLPICSLVENAPPPAGAPASIDMQLAAGSVVTVKDAAGNVLWKGTA